MDNDHSEAENLWKQFFNDSTDTKYILTLYIAGSTPKSTRAIANIKALCDRYLDDRYELEVVDLYQHPEMILDSDVVALPALVKKLPLPLRQLVGDMTNENQVLTGLDLRKKE